MLAGCEPCGDGSECGPPVAEPPVEPPAYVPTDVTFIAFGDPQYGGGADDKNGFQVAAINGFPGTLWPEGSPWAGEPVDEPRGVLIAGDLTQNGQDGRIDPLDSDELGRFELDYGLRGDDGGLRFPVYEGYGNHDFDPAQEGEYGPFNWQYHYEGGAPAADRVAERNPDRVGLTAAAGGTDGHYAWDWDWLHLVNADLFPGDEPSDAGDHSLTRDPRGALGFLEDDLAARVGDTGRPVIIMSHYGFDGFSQQPRWWTEGQKDAFWAAIEPYELVLYLHGHTHATSTYEVEGRRVLNLGSPYYTEYNADGRGHFTVVRVTDDYVVAWDAAWAPGEAAEWGSWSIVLER